MDQHYQVLIFDDDIALGEMLREYLVIVCGSDVTLVHNEEEFWRAIHGCNYDILFLDYQLPRITGLNILEKLAAEQCPVPTVMMTGQGNEKIAARAIQMGAIDYLVKSDLSFSLGVLPNLIQRAVQLRRLQVAVRQSEEKVQYQALLLENVRDAVVVWDMSGMITYWNSAAEQIYERSASEMIGKSVYQTYFNLFSPPVELPEKLEEGGKIQAERTFSPPGSGRVWISSQISPLYATDQQLNGYMDVSRDITVSKLEQEELDRSRHLIQRILEASPNIVYTLNLRTNQIDYISPKIEPVLGLHVADVLRARNPFFFSMVEPKDLPVLVKHYNEMESLEEGEISEIEYRIKLDRNEWRWLRNRETAFSRDEAGHLVEIIGVCEDITHRKQAEEKQAARMNSEKLLATLGTHFIGAPPNNLNENLAEAVKSVAEFIGMEVGMLYLTEGGKLRRRVSYKAGDFSASGERPTTPRPLEAMEWDQFPWLCEEARRQPLIVVNSLDDLDPLARPEMEIILRPNLRSAAIVPLLRGEDLRGMLIFGTISSAMKWEKDYNDLAMAFGQILVKATAQG